MASGPATATTPLGGLTGLRYTENDTATAEERLGGPANPKHANLGEVAKPYPWEQFPNEPHGPYGLDNELLGIDIASYTADAGMLNQDPTADLQPLTHAAPWPKGVASSPYPDAQDPYRVESYAIHSSDMGADRRTLYVPTLVAKQDDWRLIDDTSPGVMIPAQAEVPNQSKNVAAGWGSRDRLQSQAQQNQYGFDSAHMQRRYAAGHIPGLFLWLTGASRPMVKSIPGGAQVPVGVDSPFYGQVPPDAYGAAYPGALQVLPTQYVPPPDPSVAATYASNEPPAVDLW